MSRIFLPIISIHNNQISIIGKEARYLLSVLRCKKGDELTVFDGKGSCFRTSILNAGRKEIIAEVLAKIASYRESPLNIVLVQGLLKGQKMDIVVQKSTELGVKGIIPVITDRCQPRETRKVSRWRKIAEEASKQCGRSMVPIVYEPVEFNQFFDIVGRLKESGESEKRRHGKTIGLIFWEEGGLSLKEAFNKFSSSSIDRSPDSPVQVLIGPEGGFTKKEVSIAEEKGFIVTSLGMRILRAETAAISAITLVQFMVGDLG